MVELIGPNGIVVELFNSVGGRGAGFIDTVLDDDGTMSIADGSAPFTGVYTPTGDLTRFEGMTVTGSWTLQVADVKKRETGRLNSWSIIVERGTALMASEAPQVSVEMNLPAGWSMISLPIIPDDASVATLFPDAAVVYSYEKGSGYTREQTLEIGKGYWILLNAAQSYTLTGRPIQENTPSGNQHGWDMIGGDPNSAQALVRQGQKIDVIYEYVPGGGYQRVRGLENLEPGKGYWIRRSPVQTENTLTEDALNPFVDEAIARWTEVLGSDDTTLSGVTFQIADLEGLMLGRAVGDTMLIDIDAAGHGWFVDESPYDDIEFGIERGGGELLATTDSEAYGRMDLLTAVMHELGHILGLEDLDDPETYGLMSATLDTGMRRLPGIDDITAMLQE